MILIASDSLFLTWRYEWKPQGDLFKPEYLEQVLRLAEGFTDRQPTHFFMDGERFEKVLDTERERM